MATIKDIANLAGVSHGTVSNVLNKKGNVSVQKINLVENAVRQLGFKPNAQAKQLKQGKTNRVAIIVPKLQIKRYGDLYAGLAFVLNDSDYDLTIYSTDDSVEKETKLVDRICAENPSALIVISASLQRIARYKDSMLFYVERRVSDPDAFFYAFDFERAGTELAESAVKSGRQRVAVFCGPARYSCNEDFVRGCISVLKNAGCRCSVFYSEEPMCAGTAFAIVSDDAAFDAVLVFGHENEEYVKTAHAYYNPASPLQIFTVTNKSMMHGFETSAYELNYKYLGCRIAQRILHKTSETEKECILPADGFLNPSEAPRRIAKRYRRFRHGPAAYRIDIALRGDIPWLYDDARRAGTIHLGDPVATENDIAARKLPDLPFTLVGQQYLADPTRSTGNLNPIWAYAHVPAGYRGDVTSHILTHIEHHAPGFHDQIEQVWSRSVQQLEDDNPNYSGGDIAGGANTLRQLVARPRLRAPYDTGVPGVYLASASTPPGGGVHGMAGYHAARRALELYG